jgi:MFS family permease
MNNESQTGNIFFNKNLQMIFCVSLVYVLGVTSITPAFPQIARYFEIETQEIGLLIVIFTLPGIFLTPILGIIADRIGRKKVLVPSLILFGTAGFACAFTRDFEILLVMRFLQGVGYASLGSLNAAIIGDLFEGKERAAAMGYNAQLYKYLLQLSYPFIGRYTCQLLIGIFVFYLPGVAVPIAIACNT